MTSTSTTWYETISYLAISDLKFRRDDETIAGSTHNRGYLGCLEIVSKFDFW